MRFMKYLVVVLCISVLASCGSKPEKENEGVSEQTLYERAQRYLKASNWSSSIQVLQLIEENFPFGTYAENAQLELCYAYFRSGEYELSIASSDRFIRLHPQHRDVDYAYYMRGVASFYKDSAITTALISDISQRDSGSAKDSFNYFSQLLTRFPESQYALDAQRRMIYLRNILARHEIHVANYYFKRGAYVAAANRGRFVVENMQGTPAVPDGLAVMAQAYHLLGMQNLADDAAKILVLNYPQHPSVKKGQFEYQKNINESTSWLSYLTLGLFGKRKFVNFDSRDVFNSQYMDNDVPSPNEV
ncbi:Outer membrane protein assembly factor BamD [Thalassocella blandensis]|nr:Outer membrane protein assembly factor BamD [Thalassocella blandensis]